MLLNNQKITEEIKICIENENETSKNVERKERKKRKNRHAKLNQGR